MKEMEELNESVFSSSFRWAALAAPHAAQSQLNLESSASGGPRADAWLAAAAHKQCRSRLQLVSVALAAPSAHVQREVQCKMEMRLCGGKAACTRPAAHSTSTAAGWRAPAGSSRPGAVHRAPGAWAERKVKYMLEKRDRGGKEAPHHSHAAACYQVCGSIASGSSHSGAVHRAPSAWAEREVKYKMEKRDWGGKEARLQATIERLRAENLDYRATNKAAEFEKRIKARCAACSCAASATTALRLCVRLALSACAQRTWTTARQTRLPSSRSASRHAMRPALQCRHASTLWLTIAERYVPAMLFADSKSVKQPLAACSSIPAPGRSRPTEQAKHSLQSCLVQTKSGSSGQDMSWAAPVTEHMDMLCRSCRVRCVWQRSCTRPGCFSIVTSSPLRAKPVCLRSYRC